MFLNLLSTHEAHFHWPFAFIHALTKKCHFSTRLCRCVQDNASCVHPAHFQPEKKRRNVLKGDKRCVVPSWTNGWAEKLGLQCGLFFSSPAVSTGSGPQHSPSASWSATFLISLIMCYFYSIATSFCTLSLATSLSLTHSLTQQVPPPKPKRHTHLHL